MPRPPVVALTLTLVLALALLPAPAAALAMAPVTGVTAQDDLRDKVDAALARARPALLEHLRLQDGGVLALACLAAAHDEVPREDRTFAAALERLSRAELTTTYELALRLMVMAEVAQFPRRDRLVGRDAKRLLGHRLGGGFTYPAPQDSWDLSNTQYAALGLRAAAALGAAVPAKVWADMAKAVVAAQAEDGGFAYTSKHRRHRPYASMTVAGIAVLELCRQHLGRAASPAASEAAITRAWAWMARNAIEVGNPDALSCYYFHYGLERAAILSDVERVGDVDWYRAGAEMLVVQQRRDGAWRGLREIRPGALGGAGSPVDTAFAVLFLRRKFQKEVRPVTGEGGLERLSAASGDDEIARVAESIAARGTRGIRTVLRGLRSEVAPRRRAAVAALVRLAGTDFGIHPELPPTESARAIVAAERWGLRAEGSGR